VLGAAGAEQLPPRHFLTVMDNLVCGVAFAPTDEEIGAFLAARPIPPYPTPAWLASADTGGTGRTGVDETAGRIQALLADGRSMRAVQLEVFGYTGGAAYEAVQAQFQAGMGDTTTT
jgi:hypothetical protein